jgi:hypothetical protein
MVRPAATTHGFAATWRKIMKHLAIIVSLVGGLWGLSATEASAVVCARGVYRAGCAGTNGAVAVRRPVAAPRAVVVAPRATVVRRGAYVRPRY